ncbi:hypothetical protein [Nodularia sp. UHCC 0506]|uniref:hypothetical protein n=1 Tax=Nodularia sp. UHCC 0506 TaxID=3110243 RepID=UPI002B1F16A5|nr:hypothetical protein [Nodularia sp. UHCC 0506]MEA5517067.1 hypothetical protein [Nodularia sp. UHCC 0506]
MGGVTDRKTDTFTDVYLEIKHEYWGKWVGVTEADSNNGYVNGKITFKNTGKLPLSDVKLFLDLDDTGMTWDANTRNSDGSVSDLGVLDLGLVAPGAEVEYKYWWGLKHLFGPTQEDFTVTFNIIPQFQVRYSKSSAFKSGATVSAS